MISVISLVTALCSVQKSEKLLNDENNELEWDPVSQRSIFDGQLLN